MAVHKLCGHKAHIRDLHGDCTGAIGSMMMPLAAAFTWTNHQNCLRHAGIPCSCASGSVYFVVTQLASSTFHGRSSLDQRKADRLSNGFLLLHCPGSRFRVKPGLRP